jgi:hypothetical protein
MQVSIDNTYSNDPFPAILNFIRFIALDKFRSLLIIFNCIDFLNLQKIKFYSLIYILSFRLKHFSKCSFS